MKKFLFTILLIFLVNSVSFATEKMSIDVQPTNSYLILLSKSAQTLTTTNKEIADASILTTIFNEKDQIILKIYKEGKTKLFIELEDDIIVIDINSDKNNILASPIKCTKDIKDFLKLDKPYFPTIKTLKNKLELDPPPPLGDIK